MKTQEIFNKLWSQYTSLNPHAKSVYNLLVSKGEVVENDHIAFRTFNDPRIDIEVLSTIFKKAGYIEMHDYHFEVKTKNCGLSKFFELGFNFDLYY